MVHFDHVTAGYDGKPAIVDITFRVDEPAFVTVLGPNGAGKTTLLRVALGLVKPLKGRVVVLGLDVTKEVDRVRHMVGYVPQRERISQDAPVLVRDVVLMGIISRKPVGRAPNQHDVEKAREALRAVGMEDMWDEPFSHLSGGQQQRVLIARALAADPKLLLLDEPFSGVDSSSQRIIIEVLRELVDNGIGVLLVTHDVNPLMRVTDYVLLLNKRVLGFGRPTEALTPSALRETYGRDVEIITVGGACFVITGDSHA